MSVLEWPCKGKCGRTLNDIGNSILKKYCNECKHRKILERAKRTYHQNKTIKPKGIEKMLYLLKTNKIVSEGEIVAFSGLKQESIKQMAFQLRRKGHNISKKRYGMYYYVD